MTKIDIFSGFLGAGKTTLIKKLIREVFGGEKLVLIENEFGEIGVDGGFLKESGIQITERNSGCICCSLVGDFGRALEQVLDQYHPDRILIEPSGVGKLSDVIRAVQRVGERAEITLNSFTTVADATKCRVYIKNFGEFYDDQVSHANTIILSRTGGMDEAKLEKAVALLREKNPNATIITTPWEELSGDKILAAMERRSTLEQEIALLAEETAAEHHHHEEEECDDPNCSCHEHHHDHDHEHHDHDHHDHEHEHHHHHDGEECDDPNCSCHHHHDHEGHEHHHHHADEVFTSWGMETPRKYTEAELRFALEGLSDAVSYGIVLRAKGILPAADGEWLHFDYVPGEIEIRRGGADVTGRLCVIGSGLDEENLAELFHLA